MKVVVTGGTGFVGKSLVRALAERGDDVVVMSRTDCDLRSRLCGLGPRPQWHSGSGKVELHTWSPDRHGTWVAALEGADAVVNLAGAPIFDEGWSPERRETLRGSRIRTTELLANAIARTEKKPKVFVSGSAAGIYGTGTSDRILTEDDPPGEGFLAQLTRDWESAAAPAAEAGVRVCHPRIGMVLGRSGGILAKLIPHFRAYLGGPLGTGEQYMGWVHLVDVVRALEYAMDSDLSGPFNVTAPEPVTMETFAQALGESLGRPALVRVPPLAVKLAFGERAEAILTGQRAVPRRLVESRFAFVFLELVSALADLVMEQAPPLAVA